MILGVESSCDESGLALLDDDTGAILSEVIASQIEVHREYGGVVPDLASRAHLENFSPALDVLRNEFPQALDRVSRIAVTRGPGLAGCLALGIGFAKSLSLALGVPLLGVNHLRGHLYSPFISCWSESPITWPKTFEGLLPHLGLIVSGGNTILARIDTNEEVHILAETVDDAAGEALDKGAKLLGMPYPGGPHIERASTGGDPSFHPFPVAGKSKNDRRFSFSGLKTSLRYFLEKTPSEVVDARLADICASYQHAVFEQLARKMEQILNAYGDFKSIGISGGVANNQTLRRRMEALSKKRSCPLMLAEPRHSGDNATMIGFAALANPHAVVTEDAEALSFEPSWPLADNLSPL